MKDVTIVRWPDERGLRQELARSGRARLLLVDTGGGATHRIRPARGLGPHALR